MDNDGYKDEYILYCDYICIHIMDAHIEKGVVNRTTFLHQYNGFVVRRYVLKHKLNRIIA